MPELDPELKAIFETDPRFKEVLANYERRGTSDPRDPSGFRVDSVTDEALQAYIDAGFPRLAPVIERRDNQHFAPGQGAPPPVGGIEDDTGQQRSQEPPAGSPTPPAPEGGPPPVQAPIEQQTAEQRLAEAQRLAGEQQPPPPDPSTFRLDQIPPERLAALEAFDQTVREDPRLQQILYSYLQSGEIPEELVRRPRSQPTGAGVSAPAPVAAPTPPPDLDLTDPSTKLLWDSFVASQQQYQQSLAQQQQLMGALAQRLEDTQSQFYSRVNNENEALVDRVKSSFARQHGIDQAEADRLEQVAVRLGVLQQLARGIDPISGQAVRPDAMSAVERSLEIAWEMDPIARERQRQQDLTDAQSRVREDQERRQRLAGVGGGSGSQPRDMQPQIAATPEGRRDQMVEELRTMMFGQGA